MTAINKLFSSLFVLCLSFTMSSQTAMQYMDRIGKEFDRVSRETWDYTRAVAHNKKAKLIESKRRDMINANRNAFTRIKNMPDFKGDVSYRDSTARYLELSYIVLNNDYAKIVDMEEISEQSYDAMEAYMTAQERANERLEAAFEVAANAQKEFARNNNIKLVDNESATEEKLEKASEVFKFYNKVYLAFYKPYKQEYYLLEAQSKEDINAMKQNQESLSSLSKKAKEQLRAIKPYKGNTTLVGAANDMMDFYIYEADKRVPLLIDFYLKKEKFDKLKTAIDKKSNPSKAEINEYNAGVNEFNKVSNDYNRINDELNTKRNANLENWNRSVAKYLDRNVSNK